MIQQFTVELVWDFDDVATGKLVSDFIDSSANYAFAMEARAGHEKFGCQFQLLKVCLKILKKPQVLKVVATLEYLQK